VEVIRVLVRDGNRPRAGVSDAGVLTSDVDHFIATDADIVVEALGGIEPAHRIATATLRRGARFVTANKSLIAAHGAELAGLARRSGGTLCFDAAVGGGVPVLRLITSALGGTPPRVVRGILNGTANFILTLIERGRNFDDALALARACGFAETDSTRDLDGRDAADKVAIVAWTAFGIAPDRVLVRRRGLLPDPERLVRLAQLVDGRLRLVAECERIDDGSAVVASVEPIIVAADSSLGSTLFEDNRIELHAGWSAPLAASGPGAGGTPTAAALLSDLACAQPVAPPRVGPITARPDERAFQWVVGTHHTPAILRALLWTGGVTAEALGRSGSETWARTDRAPWPTLASVLSHLTIGGAEPIVARLDDRSGANRFGETE
jgi:homoserine dehydrogenase